MINVNVYFKLLIINIYDQYTIVYHIHSGSNDNVTSGSGDT